VKVWEKREYRDLDDSVTIGSRNIKVALKRLRKFAREGLPNTWIWMTPSAARHAMLATWI